MWRTGERNGTNSPEVAFFHEPQSVCYYIDSGEPDAPVVHVNINAEETGSPLGTAWFEVDNTCRLHTYTDTQT